MPTTLLQSVLVLDAASEWHNQRVDIRLTDGKVTQIAANLPPEDGETVVSDATHVSPGWIGSGVELSTPGYEPRETLQNLSVAAQTGGFQSLITLPTCRPTLDTADNLLAQHARTASLSTQFYFLATLTTGRAGERMAPIAELAEAGAIGFSDGAKDINDSSLLVRLLQYTQLVDGLVVTTPQDATLAANGMANESPTTVALGMPGIPNIAEAIAIERALRLLDYTGGRLHLSNITTAEGVALIRRAKADGLRITADTSVPYLYFTDDALHDFDSNLKLSPPLRTGNDRSALIGGLQDGTLDCISLHHQPRSVEEKRVEFAQAHNGMLTLQTAFSMLHAALIAPGHFTPATLVPLLSTNVSDVFGLPRPRIAVGERPTAFSLEGQTPVTRELLGGRAYNTPLLEQVLSRAGDFNISLRPSSSISALISRR